MHTLLLLLPLPLACTDDPSKLADAYVEAIEKVNAAHAKKPRDRVEADLADEVPRRAVSSLEKLLKVEDDDGLGPALVRAAEAALDLDRIEDFTAASGRLAEVDPDLHRELGVALSHPRFVLRGLGGLDLEYLGRFADVLEAVLAGYDEVFGFEEISKVPGKKLRVKVHLEEAITRPPHFEPQFAYHSQIDFPVIDPEAFRSPTQKGQFLFYGLCHEIGHVIAMWGDRRNEEDHHAWAHYTGVVLVEHLAEKELPALREARDVRWRSIACLREEVDGVGPSTDSREGVLALLLGLHDAVGPRAIGAAINHLDEQDDRLRINRVRYYSFRELRDGLRATLRDKEEKARVDELLSDG